MAPPPATSPPRRPRVLYVEPFDGGSHAAFGEALLRLVDAEWTRLTLPGRHWKWRMRGAVAYFVRAHAETLARPYDAVLASAYTPLAELVGLAPALGSARKILYFHENQLAFPVQEERERDHHYGFTQLVSSLAADVCAFNSAWNRDSFLGAARGLLGRMPDAVAPGWVDAVAARSVVLPLPLDDGWLGAPFAGPVEPPSRAEREVGPVLLWAHRWEYDKAPEAFFDALRTLADRGVAFRVAVAGQRFRRAPAVFEEARAWLGDRVMHWGYAADRAAYLALLRRADVGVSTAIHEFFGVSMVEAAHHGARPLVPDRLAYPELFPAEYRYEPGTLADRLEALCRAYSERGQALRGDFRALTRPLGSPSLVRRYADLLAPGGAMGVGASDDAP